MPPRKHCKKENPTEDPYRCLQKGIAIGKNLTNKVTLSLTKDVLRRIAQLNKIRNYSNMSKTELYQALIAKGVTRYKPFDL